MSSPYLISRQRVIAAPPQRIFELLASPAMHGVIDGSGTVRRAQPNGPERLSLGAKFGMEMKIGVGYKTVCPKRPC
ncbi:hypothetical protein IV498_12875 [Paenarthrobacter sp. Z7-10]|uniref:hypothetical protein n=1 Tax=Paenarthrobacter sp. Z7-10 TaxID=2787635 RepID=UPI0022A9D192|nr:hypothetical protein [Paenarthrobacter sp. Z7-10]MCZ2404050.1 hypothetical protein [Paenarthrobacter sp. Z7-10]